MFRTPRLPAALAAVFALTPVAAGQIKFPIKPPPSPIPAPNIPKPNIPNPLDEAAKRERELREAAARKERELREAAARKEKEAREAAARAEEQARKQAARVDELRKQAERTVRDFNRMKDEFEKNKKEYDRLAALAKSDKLDPQKEAVRALVAAGVIGSNRAEIDRGINAGLGVVVRAKEFDHFEQIKFGTALAGSVASANPGPALAYVKGFAYESKAAVMRGLKAAPEQARRKVQGEFETLLVRGLDAAVNGKRPPAFGVTGVDITVALATFNHWVDIRMNQPRLVETEKVLGVQLYRIDTSPKAYKVPLPNTFQPYLRVRVTTTR